MRPARVLALIALLTLAATPGIAAAYDEPNGMFEGHQGTVATVCTPCHRPPSSACDHCHMVHGNALPDGSGKGPHGYYTATTDRCDACHDVHVSGGAKLLGAATVTGSCYTCHDGTGGKGVYGTIAARGVAVGAQHRVDTTSIVPGGDYDGLHHIFEGKLLALFQIDLTPPYL